MVGLGKATSCFALFFIINFFSLFAHHVFLSCEFFMMDYFFVFFPTSLTHWGRCTQVTQGFPGPFIRGKIRRVRLLDASYKRGVLNKTRTFRINGTLRLK